MQQKVEEGFDATVKARSSNKHNRGLNRHSEQIRSHALEERIPCYNGGGSGKGITNRGALSKTMMR